MRLVRAEMLKLRRRRGLMIWTSLLTLGPPIVGYAILVSLHAASPHHHGPAGGTDNLQGALGLIATLGGLAGILLGTTAGSQDASAGVFRDLVVTGRPRRTLFEVRAPGALAIYLPQLALSFALAVGGAYAFAGGLATPSAHDVLRYAEWIFAAGVLNVALATALASIVPSRIATGVLVAWNVAIAPLLVRIDALGAARKGIATAAAESLAPQPADAVHLTMAGGTAAAVIVVWVAVSLRVGALWTQRRDA